MEYNFTAIYTVRGITVKLKSVNWMEISIIYHHDIEHATKLHKIKTLFEFTRIILLFAFAFLIAFLKILWQISSSLQSSSYSYMSTQLYQTCYARLLIIHSTMQ